MIEAYGQVADDIAAAWNALWDVARATPAFVRAVLHQAWLTLCHRRCLAKWVATRHLAMGGLQITPTTHIKVVVAAHSHNTRVYFVTRKPRWRSPQRSAP